MRCRGWASAHPPLSVVAGGNLGEEREILAPVRVALLREDPGEPRRSQRSRGRDACSLR